MTSNSSTNHNQHNLTVGHIQSLPVPSTLNFAIFTSFLRIVRYLKDKITLYSTSRDHLPPPELPSHIVAFVTSSFRSISPEDVSVMWLHLKEWIWDKERVPQLSDEEREMFGLYDQREHAFISQKLCEVVTAWMVLAWVSAQNSAAIYNSALSSVGEGEGSSYDSSLNLTSTQVWRAFVLNAPLRDRSESGQALVLTENLEHDQRLKEAQCARNKNMDRNGQPERLHACSICEHFIPTDLPDAFQGLRNLHYESEKSKCAVVDCNNPVQANCRTCTIESHIAMEDYRNLKGKGFFLLKKWLERVGGTESRDLLAASDDLSDDEELDEPAHKSDSGNVKIRVRFACRRTHNEQLVVACCGMITGRATMFGAEAISGVKDFLKSVYPSRDELPDVIFHDNNYDYFKNVILPVDVFYFKSKHKVTGEFCQKHCNPAQWSELVGDDGKWIFNSSVVEQTNSWIVGYQAIVRDMLPHNYDFFLDETIKRRNELLRNRLLVAGKIPYCMPSAAELQ
ncbi:hypothetical protein PQX77_021351 [Marasmius sp. AFHP31]|nr:hypothetical protein PQX77_021351 [Marasmius sp. AFHP31]